MTEKEFIKLSKGQYINHIRYGVSEIEEIIVDFGILINPITYNGIILLYFDAKQCETFKDLPLGSPFLETEAKKVQFYTPSWTKNKNNNVQSTK
jgi:hypothetical protein